MPEVLQVERRLSWRRWRHCKLVDSGDSQERKLKTGAETVKGRVEESDESDTIMVTLQRLIADRPHNKIHRDFLDGQNGERAWATPTKKQKVKCEEVDGDSDSDYVA